MEKKESHWRAVEILLFAVFGGSNVVWGPLLGSVILTSLPEVLRSAAVYREMIYGAILVTMMIFRPQGLLSEDTIRLLKNKLSPSTSQRAADVIGGQPDDSVS